jgi:peptide/nickel transport system ATP-binding protein
VTSALDPLVAAEILKLLTAVQDRTGVAYIFITHDIGTASAVSDTIAVMYQGEVVEYGPRSDVLTNPRHDYTQLLLSSVPRMEPGWLQQVLGERSLRQSRLL